MVTPWSRTPRNSPGRSWTARRRHRGKQLLRRIAADQPEPRRTSAVRVQVPPRDTGVRERKRWECCPRPMVARTPGETVSQIIWGVNHITGRYRLPSAAPAFHNRTTGTSTVGSSRSTVSASSTRGRSSGPRTSPTSSGGRFTRRPCSRRLRLAPRGSERRGGFPDSAPTTRRGGWRRLRFVLAGLAEACPHADSRVRLAR